MIKTYSIFIFLISLTEVHSRRFKKTGKNNRIAFCLSLTFGLLFGIFLFYYLGKKICPNGINLNIFEDKSYRALKKKKVKSKKSYKEKDIEEEYEDFDNFFDIRQGSYQDNFKSEKESITSLIDNHGWDSTYLVSRNLKTKNTPNSPQKNNLVPSPILMNDSKLKEFVKADEKISPAKTTPPVEKNAEEEIDLWAEWNKTAGVPLSEKDKEKKNIPALIPTNPNSNNQTRYKHSLPSKPPPMKPPPRKKAPGPPPSKPPQKLTIGLSNQPSSILPLSNKNSF